jgi:hypothetical protein
MNPLNPPHAPPVMPEQTPAPDGPQSASTRHVAGSNVAGGPDNVTATMSANPSTYLSIHIHEYARLADSNAFDVDGAHRVRDR